MIGRDFTNVNQSRFCTARAERDLVKGAKEVTLDVAYERLGWTVESSLLEVIETKLIVLGMTSPCSQQDGLL